MIIFYFPLVFIFLIYLEKILFGSQNDFYNYFAREDGPIEFATVFLYFSSFVFSLINGFTFIKQKKNLFALLYLLLSASFFFIALEEISWGQRIFLIENPEYFIDNVQNEMNFHNLSIFDHFVQILSFLLVAVVGFTFWAFFTHSDKLKDRPFTKFFVPQGFTMSYFISVMIFYQIFLFRQFIPRSSEGLLNILQYPDHEVFEFLLSAGIFIFIVSKFIELKNLNKISKL